MNTQTALHGLRVLSVAMIAGLVVCAPAHAHGGGNFGAVGHAGGFGCCFWQGYGLLLATLPFYYVRIWPSYHSMMSWIGYSDSDELLNFRRDWIYYDS